MMTKDEARRRILDEWNHWLASNVSERPPAHMHAHQFFFGHLQPNRPELLDFRADREKWDIVQSWLRIDAGLR